MDHAELVNVLNAIQHLREDHQRGLKGETPTTEIEQVLERRP